jgi:hypothetical protein
MFPFKAAKHMEDTQCQIAAVWGMGQYVSVHGTCHALDILCYFWMKGVVHHCNTPHEDVGTLSHDGGMKESLMVVLYADLLS